MVTLGEDHLDNLWQKWINHHYDLRTRDYLPGLYKYVQRRTGAARKFEDWLYTHGATVRQENKHRFIEFFDDKQAMIFSLKFL